MCVYYTMITTVSLLNILHHTEFFLVVRTFKIYSLSSCQIYTTELLTVVAVLYITSPGLIHLITGSLCPLTTFICSRHPLPPASGDHQSVLFLWVCLFVFKIPLIGEIIQDLSFSVWFISLSVIASRSIHVVPNGRISFFFMAEYSKSPTCEWVPFREHVRKSNLFVSPTELTSVPN